MKLVIDATAGTHVLGSSHGRLETTYRDRYGDAYPHQSTGMLTYDPKRANGKVPEPWWLIALTDNGIAAYYRRAIEKRFGFILDEPSWGSHISIIRGERPTQNETQWGHSDGLITNFVYSHEVYTNGLHWWVNVDCPDYAALRAFYGFDPGKRHFHLTVGRVRNKDVLGTPPALPPDA